MAGTDAVPATTAALAAGRGDVGAELGRGTKVFDSAPVRGRWKAMESADDVLDLMDTSAEGVIALVRDAGATFLAPIFHELAGIVCTGGTPRSHIGIVSREFQVPCVMGLVFGADGEPADGDGVEIDCTGAIGVLRRVVGGVAATGPVIAAVPRAAAHVADLAAEPLAAGSAGLLTAAPNPVTPEDVERVRAWINERINYIAPISRGLTEERTALESKIIPVSAYIVVACIESFLRYPEMMRAIEQVMPADEIGRRARRPGCRVNTVYLWSVVNFWLIGRKVWEMVDPASAHDLANARDVFEFWERAALSFRGGDGTRHAADTSTVTPYSTSIIEQLLAGVTPVDDSSRAEIRSFNATLVAWLFLLYFDTRVGHGDTGPYPLPDGRVLLVRDFYELAESDFWWSDVARDVPYRNLTAALVLDGVTVDRVTDFGTSYTTPEDFVEGLVGFGLYTTDGMPPGELRPVPLSEMPAIVAAVRAAQAAHYRNIAAMTRDEKIRCGAYVYFSFLRPFAQLAGVEDRLDWTVPRDIPEPLYGMVSMMEGDNGGVTDDGPYYSPLPG